MKYKTLKWVFGAVLELEGYEPQQSSEITVDNGSKLLPSSPFNCVELHYNETLRCPLAKYGNEFSRYAQIWWLTRVI